MSDRYNAEIVFRRDVTENLCILKILPAGGVPHFRSGQYLTIGLEQADSGKLLQRAYSVASSPSEKDGFEFFIAKVEDGQLTPQLFHLQPGDRLFVAKKVVGTFVLPDTELPKHLIFVATGTGIAPYVSMIRSGLLDSGVERVDVVYTQIHFWPVVSRDPENPRFTRGHVQAVVLEKLPIVANETRVYLCGNPGMITDLTEALQVKGLVLHSPKIPGNIIVENYW
jgi:ferredoxin--NADP+ reductase